MRACEWLRACGACEWLRACGACVRLSLTCPRTSEESMPAKKQTADPTAAYSHWDKRATSRT
jgi:hypothetical protein